MRTIAIILLLATLAAADSKPGDEGTAEYKKALELVTQLGHAQFAVREAAAKQLIEMDHAAVPALNDAAKSSDAEVRNRCIALLPQAKAAGWKRLAAEYLADTDGKQKHDLPLLSEWEKLVGKPDAASRKLFALMLSNNSEFLAQADSARAKTREICTARCKVMFDGLQTPAGQKRAEFGDLAAMLFVDTLDPIRLGLRIQAMPFDLFKNAALVEMLDAKEIGPAFRRLLVQWAAAQPAINSPTYVRFADLTRKKPFAEAAPLLVKLAKSERRGFLNERLLAIEALGAVGGKEADAALAELAGDAGLMYGGDMWKEFQLGDQALAASLIMYGEKVGKYELISTGMITANMVGKEELRITVYGFPDADARTRAIKKWRDEVLKTKASKEKK